VARDLRAATLYDLVAALGLNLAPGAAAAAADTPGWARQLHELVASSDAAARETLGLDLQALIDGDALEGERPG